jgi:hypothetical protein
MRAVIAAPLIAAPLLLLCATARPNSGPIQPVFRLADFPTPLRIDNWFLPMKAGTRIVARELEDGECKVNDVVVTDLVKHDFRGAYAGMAARAVFDRVWSDPKCDGTRHLLLENTTDWYGQDKHGNVWYFGEATVEYTYDRNGHRIDADTEGSWEAGRDGALAGIVMLAESVPGVFYRQEYLPGAAEDSARVEKVNIRVSTALGNFTGCLETRETTTLAPGDIEYKYYCPNVGVVRVVAPSADGGAETVTLALR